MKPNPPKTARNARVLELHNEGMSISGIAEQLVAEGHPEISRQRVWQLIQAAKRREQRSLERIQALNKAAGRE